MAIGHIALVLEEKEMQIAAKDAEVESLKAQLEREKRGRKVKTVPNPSRRFVDVSETLAAGNPIEPIVREGR
ncbi:hypothetical protein PG994_009671 [Apiospora phragmitis]|uniref:Transposase n=1 Tax=Apiospora phragmitis TaxID=2905665 RepID=A0ABR1U9H9_9PEZI